MLTIKISIADVCTMLGHAKTAGVDTDAVLSRIGLAEAGLGGTSSANQLWLAYDNLGRALRKALSEAKGLRPFDDVDREIFLHYLVGADTLRDVLVRLAKFMASHYERMGTPYEVDGGLPTVVVLRGYHRIEVADATLILSYLRSINQLLYLMSWLANTRVMPVCVGLPGAYSEDVAHQLAALDCPVNYKLANFEVWFSAQALERPLVRDLADVKTFLKFESGVERGLTAQLSLADIATEMIERHCLSTGHMLTLQQLALVLNTSETTLRRRLQKDGACDGFSAIRQNCQLRLAQRLLINAELTVDEIAQRIGFQDSNAFRRSFKRWTGQTPSEYRVGNVAPSNPDNRETRHTHSTKITTRLSS